MRFFIWSDWKLHELNVVPVKFFSFELFEDFFFDCRTGEEDVESHLVSGRHLVAVAKPQLVVDLVVGRDPVLSPVVHDGVKIIVSEEPRHLQVPVCPATQPPPLEISV